MNDESSVAPVVDLQHVSRRFGSTQALDDVSLTIPEGSVFGLVGANGAGKTTLIRHIMGLLRAERGCVSVFGLDPIANPTSVLSRLGYLSEVSELPEWMRVHELLRFTRAFYASWDESYAESLVRTFELDRDKKVHELSKGQRARFGLVLALAPRPRLLVLDEPSSGLDPLVRRDILRAIIRTIAEEGRTVLFSSHLLEEVERVADRVAIIERGRVIQSDELESLKSSYQRLVLHFESAPVTLPATHELFNWQGSDRHWSAFFRGDPADAENLTRRYGARLVEHATPSLNEIFFALVGSARSHTEERP